MLCYKGPWTIKKIQVNCFLTRGYVTAYQIAFPYEDYHSVQWREKKLYLQLYFFLTHRCILLFSPVTCHFLNYNIIGYNTYDMSLLKCSSVQSDSQVHWYAVYCRVILKYIDMQFIAEWFSIWCINKIFSLHVMLPLVCAIRHIDLTTSSFLCCR